MLMKKLFFIILSIFLLSCQDNIEESSKINSEVFTKDTEVLKKRFCKALAMVLSESEIARDLIKNEALKKINYDYDVLYEFVKNEPLENGYLFKDLLLKHIEKESLEELEKLFPTLTLFVPKLPNNSFSAELWDSNKDIPVIAMISEEENGVPMFSYLGEEWVVEN